MDTIKTIFFDSDAQLIRYALFAGILASIAFGIVGSFVVIKRISYIAGAISHSVLGGIGLSLFLNYYYQSVWFDPIIGAFVFALISALLIGGISYNSKDRSDTIISAIWVVGMSLGIIFITKTPGYIDPMSYLFGNILMISSYDFYMIISLNTIIIIFVVLFYNKLLAISFDEEFVRLKGINTKIYYFILLFLIAITVVVMIRIVGIMMVLALLTLPGAVAGKMANNLWKMILISIILSAFYVVLGVIFSFHFNLPSGPVIVLIAAIIYFITIFFAKRK